MTLHEDHDARLEEILEVLLAIARQDFGARAVVSGAGDLTDAIAVGLNMLAEELAHEVASRRELERAHAELKEAEARLIHAGKLAAVGQLASGVAHEINNPATSLEAALAIIKRACDEVDAKFRSVSLQSWTHFDNLGVAREAVYDAQEAVARIRRLTGDLRTFARTDDEQQRQVRLDEVAAVSCRLAAPMVRPHAELVLDLEVVPPVFGNRGRLGQVVTNLIVNAAQALSEDAATEHVVVVSTRHVGDEVLLAVEDSGPGVPVALRTKIFEPFYTTKPEGVGTGLGLSLVAAIVSAHSGRIHVGEGSRGGARFELSFPVAEGVAAENAEPSEVVTATPARLLLVDDEAMIVRLLTTLLSESCDVVSATSGRDAIALLEADKGFDVILCDLHMREVDGIAVYEAVERLAPALLDRFVFTTGGAVTARGREFLDRVEPRILAKPFRVEELFELIRELAGPKVAVGVR